MLAAGCTLCGEVADGEGTTTLLAGGCAALGTDFGCTDEGGGTVTGGVTGDFASAIFVTAGLAMVESQLVLFEQPVFEAILNRPVFLEQ